jgi:hypothetical protein
MPMKSFSMLRLMWIILFLGLTCILGGKAAYSIEQNRTYISLMASYGNIFGSRLDGDTVVSGFGVYISYPKLQPAPGFGITLGTRGDKLGAEISYFYSSNKTSLLDPISPTKSTITSRASNHVIGVDIKSYFWDHKKIQGYVLVGLNIVWMISKKSYFGEYMEDSSLPSDEWVYLWENKGNALILGFGGNLGGGLIYPLNSKIALTGSLYLRPLLYASITAVPAGEWKYKEATYDLSREDLFAVGLGLNVGIIFFFNKIL